MNHSTKFNYTKLTSTKIEYAHMYRHTYAYMHVLYVWVGTFISECMYLYIYAAQGMKEKIAYMHRMSNQCNTCSGFLTHSQQDNNDYLWSSFLIQQKIS